ncbi:hypothetical protein ANRL1_01259 [Anaerolineae bacterium]|nr:hypothetical protein ANRL1_01259 [Anaerolineae bacterium]
MKTKMFVLCALVLCVSALVACATPAPPPTPVPPPDPMAVIKSLSDALNAGNVDAVMAFFADDATQTQTPPPAGTSGVRTGKEQIRGFFAGMIAGKFSGELSNLKVTGDKITYTSTFSTDTYRKLGVAPLVAAEEAVFEKGKIKSQTITVTPESLAKIQAAMAAAQAKPTAAPDGEVMATKNEDVLGVWLMISPPTDHLYPAEHHIEHAADGARNSIIISGIWKGEKTYGKFWFEGGLFKTQYNQGVGQGPSIGVYQVYVTKQGGKSVQLRFVAVDDPLDRKMRMTYKPLSRVEP